VETLAPDVIRVPVGTLPRGSRITFTSYWPGAGRWEGTDFAVAVEY
jgi:hypothetical protein